MRSRIERILYEDGESALASLDRSIVSELNQCSGKGVMNDLLSEGLLKTPGKNCISLMTISGAKGSKVSLWCLLYYARCCWLFKYVFAVSKRLACCSCVFRNPSAVY